MDVTNLKINDVRKAFAAIPPVGRCINFAGRVEANNGAYTHIQGLAPYRTYHLLTHSDQGVCSGRLLVLDRTPGNEQLLGEPIPLPNLCHTVKGLDHPGGCQIIGDCLVIPVENRQRNSYITFFDLSDVTKPREIVAARKLRDRKTGAVGITNYSRDGKTCWVLCAYDNGRADFYDSDDQKFPGTFSHSFEKEFDIDDHQSIFLVTEVNDRIFAIGLNYSLNPLDAGDRATLYAVDLQAKTVDRVARLKLKTTGVDGKVLAADTREAASKSHVRWGGGLEIISATELALYCTEKHYDSGCDINSFDSRKLSVRALSDTSAPAAPIAKAGRRRRTRRK